MTRSRKTPHEARLPARKRVVFLDWHGTLSTTPFWDSIVGDQSHPLHDALRRELVSLFQTDQSRVRDWMRGLITSEDIVRELNVPLDRRFEDDFLLRRLHRDCRRMRISPAMMAIAQAIRSYAFTVVATDNMDCFERSIRRSDEFRSVADDLLCSSRIGVLKAENTERFFGPWMTTHQMRWEDALLIDDDGPTCEKFRQAGGAAIHFREGLDIKPPVRAWLGEQTWMEDPNASSPS